MTRKAALAHGKTSIHKDSTAKSRENANAQVEQSSTAIPTLPASNLQSPGAALDNLVMLDYPYEALTLESSFTHDPFENEAFDLGTDPSLSLRTRLETELSKFTLDTAMQLGQSLGSLPVTDEDTALDNEDIIAEILENCGMYRFH